MEYEAIITQGLIFMLAAWLPWTSVLGVGLGSSVHLGWTVAGIIWIGGGLTHAALNQPDSVV